MKRPWLFPAAIIIGIAIVIGISEMIIRSLNSPESFFMLGDAALLIWGLFMLAGGIFSLSSYFFETKWKGFYALIWVYKTIMPAGGKVNALIFGLSGILIGILSIIKAIAPHFFLAVFFLSSINLDNLSISSGLVL